MRIKNFLTEEITEISIIEWDKNIVGKALEDQYQVLDWGVFGNVYEVLEDGKRNFCYRMDKDHAQRMFKMYPNKFVFEEITDKISNMPTSKSNHIFVSFSQKDEKIVNRFIDLVLENGLGLNVGRDVFATCSEGGKPKNGTDFKSFIKEKLSKSSFVIQFISRNYKTSEACLNEMGAAWALDLNVKILVIEEGKYDVGFIHASHQQGFIVKQSDILNICDEIKSHFKLDISTARLTEKINEFLDFIKIEKEKSSPIIKEEKQAEINNTGRINIIIEDNDIVSIEKRAGEYLFRNNEFRLLPNSLFDKYVLGGNDSKLKIKLSEIDRFGKMGLPLPALETCEFFIENERTWVIYEGERRFVPYSVLEILKRHKITPKPISIDKLFVFPEGDALLDAKGKFI